NRGPRPDFIPGIEGPGSGMEICSPLLETKPLASPRSHPYQKYQNFKKTLCRGHDLVKNIKLSWRQRPKTLIFACIREIFEAKSVQKSGGGGKHDFADCSIRGRQLKGQP